jgi:predicted enzyme related to lactoylglutathione lyase
MASTDFGLSQIGQISINVHDLERAISFYRDQLGMKFLFRASNLGFFDCGGIRLMLGIAEKPEFDHPSSVLYFKVPDIKRAHSTLANQGVRFEGEPHIVARLETFDLWLAFFRDSEGNFLSLMSEVKK